MTMRPHLLVLALLALAALPAGAAADSWTTTGAMSTSRGAFPATLLSNGQVLVAGGFTNRTGTNTTAGDASERYDPATGSWLPSPAFADGRGFQNASLMADGRVLMTGGKHTNFDVLDSATAFDPTTNAWSAVAAMPQAHANHSQVTLQDGRVLVIGGYGTRADASSDRASNAIALYSLTLNAWTVGAPMPNSVADGTTTLLDDGSVLVAGGSSSNVPSNSALRYFPATNTWRTAGSFTDARDHQVAALLPNGKVLIAGGDFDDRRTLSSAALYDPAANSWTAVAPMASARSFATATLLPNGKVLVAGGEAAGAVLYPTYLRTAELFDPATNTWSPAPSMATERAGARATLLSDGRVLVAGGSPDPFNSTASAVIYTPDGWPFPRGGGSGGGGGGGTGGGSGAGGRPAIAGLALSATRFRAAGSGPSVTAARRRRAPVGTTITYRDAAAGTATFTVQKPASGRRAHGRCARPTRGNRRKARCTRWVSIGRFTHADTAGPNSIHFTGRVNGHKLSPRSYRLSITARVGRGRASAASTIGFRIVR
jgi:N-acetylneuraminic acid mutarotase